MVEVHLRDNKSDAQRIADRLKSSASPEAAHTSVTTGSGPQRVVTTVHKSGHQAQHGPSHSGDPDISGHKRSPSQHR